MKINLKKLRRIVDFFRQSPERFDMYVFSFCPDEQGCLAGVAAFGSDVGKARLEELCLNNAIDPMFICEKKILMSFLEMDSIEDAECLFSVDSWPDAARQRYHEADDAGDAVGRVEALVMMYHHVESRAEGDKPKQRKIKCRKMILCRQLRA